MATQFNIPTSPKKLVYQSDTFLGADFTSEASTVDDTKSPNCENMIRSVPGKIRKRMGYEEVLDYGQPIFGVHYYSAQDTYLIHAGDSLYDIKAKRGGRWGSVEDVPKATQSELYPFYANRLGGAISMNVAPPNGAVGYDVIDMNRRYNPPYGAQIAPLNPPPSPYSANYEYVRSAKYTLGSVVVDGEVMYSYCWVYMYRLRDAVVRSVVDQDETPIYLLDGDVSNTLISNQMALRRSVSFELAQKLIILDGETMWLYDTDGLHRLSDPDNYEERDDRYSHYAYIPTVSLSKDPVGYESEYSQTDEALNLATAAYKDSFYVRADAATAKVFQMSFAPLDDQSPVYVWVMGANGEMQEKTQDVDYTVDYEEGTVTFTTAPGQSPLEGNDNIKIQAYYTPEGYKDRINKCTIGAMFGVNGAHDRIFVSGNPGGGSDTDGNHYTYKNCDWWCQQYDPTYWPDLNYSKLGSDTSAIMGYSIINNYLAAHKDYRELTQSIIIREGDLVDDKPTFKIINSLQGAGAVSKYCFSYLATEPVFLTKLGVYAVTAQDVTGEKYAQDRSYYLEGKLLKEENLENAFAYAWKDYYIVAINDNLYVLDGLQPMHTDKSRPYATRQYAGFYFTNIPASCFFEMGDSLYFGSVSGKIYRFFNDEKSLASYNDAGEPITATWETADIAEKLFYKKKTYRYLALRCMPEITSSVKVYAQKQGQWDMLKDDQSKLKYFTYSQLQYSKMTYSTDKTQKISATKIRLKKLDHVRFRFVNDRLNEPLGINDFAVEYTQAGNVK